MKKHMLVLGEALERRIRLADVVGGRLGSAYHSRLHWNLTRYRRGNAVTRFFLALPFWIMGGMVSLLVLGVGWAAVVQLARMVIR